MGEPNAPWNPQWVVAPGEILVEALEERGMSQAELARRMARPVKTISEIATGKAAITPDTALQLERVLQISAGFWNGLEMRYREAQAEARQADELKRQADWVRQFPFAFLAKQRLVSGRTPADRTASLLSFFGVSSPSGWEQHWGAVTASYRLPSTVATPYPALTSWLRWGEIAAQDITTAAFDRSGLLDAVKNIPGLSRVTVFATAVRRLQDVAAQVGVAVVVTPEIPDVHVSGSARWERPDRAIVQLSLRYRSDDQFWFTVLHEMGHLLRGSGRLRGYLDEPGGAASAEEAAANAFARDTLIDPHRYAAFVHEADYREGTIEQFADHLGVSPGIVVGRLQHDGHLSHSRLNHLKRRYE